MLVKSIKSMFDNYHWMMDFKEQENSFTMRLIQLSTIVEGFIRSLFGQRRKYFGGIS